VAILEAPGKVNNIDLLTKVATATTPDSGGTSGGGGGAPASQGLKPRQSDNGFGAFYFPNIIVRDPLSNNLVEAPVSGHIAGIWARNDATRGVHKAPANEPVRGALNLTYRLTSEEQGELNQNGVNCLRLFAREGIRVWGARTLAAGASEWRYLNVRRLFNMIEESIAVSTRWIVFEPNDRTLWKSIRRDVSAFLTRIWRDGGLMGATPEEAFFVLCDEETNPPEVIDAGQVVTLIGIAPVKPAEFIIFRITQTSSGAEIEAQGGTNG
jgi:phage tail sheath protein FI